MFWVNNNVCDIFGVLKIAENMNLLKIYVFSQATNGMNLTAKI